MKTTIALIQMAVKIKAPSINYNHALNLMTQAMNHAPRPDILVLPETFNTGFSPSTSLKKFADKNGSYTKKLLSDFAKENNVNIVAGSVVCVQNDNKLYNTTYVFNRTGTIVGEYSKVHLFSPYREQDYFEAGNKLNVFKLDNIICGSMICYDLRFPELARSLMLKGAEIIFIPAEWPTIRKYPWEILNKARAIENQSFICAVNGVGNLSDTNPEKGKNAGHSMLISPLGEEILHLPEEIETIQYATINLNEVSNVRKTMSNSNDRKPKIYQL